MAAASMRLLSAKGSSGMGCGSGKVFSSVSFAPPDDANAIESNNAPVVGFEQAEVAVQIQVADSIRMH
jgi:hypothetical protein